MSIPQYFAGNSSTGRTDEVSGDGKRFLMVKDAEGATTPPAIVVVRNWFAELERLVPTRC